MLMLQQASNKPYIEEYERPLQVIVSRKLRVCFWSTTGVTTTGGTTTGVREIRIHCM